MSDKIEMMKIDPPETERTYVFPGNQQVTFQGVSGICVRPSGTHRLELSSGEKVVVNAGWLAIKLTMADWTL